MKMKDAKTLLIDFLEDEMTDGERRIVQTEIMSSGEARSELRNLSETRELVRIGLDVRHDIDTDRLHDRIMFQIENLEQVDELLERKGQSSTNGYMSESIQATVDQTLFKIHTQLKLL